MKEAIESELPAIVERSLYTFVQIYGSAKKYF